MMPIGLWRRNAGFASGLVVLLIVGLLYQSQSIGPEHYPPRAMAVALEGTFLAMVVAAAFGAWEGVRVTRFHHTRPNIRRNPATVVAFVSLPTISSTITAMLAIVLLRRAAVAANDLSVWGMLVAGLAALIGATLFGLCLGMVIPSFLAAPLAAATVYGLFIVQALLLDDQLSVLVARFDECCDTSQVIDTKAIASAVAFAAGMAGLATVLAGLLWIGERSRLLYILLPAAVLSLAVSIWLPFSLDNVYATTARKDALMCSTSETSGVQYCVWPEHKHLLGDLVTTGDVALENWQQHTSIAQPAVVTEADASISPPNAISIRLGPSSSHDDIVYAIASGIVGDPATCSLSFSGIQAYPYLMAWLLMNAGVAEDSPWMRPFGFPGPPGEPGPLEFAHKLAQSSQQTQSDWMTRALAANANCDANLTFDLT